MRIVIMGTGPFALPSAKEIHRQKHDIVCVVTRPLPSPPPKKTPPRPVFDWARDNGLQVIEPDSINAPETVKALGKLGADIFFVCDYGQILSRECLATSRLGGINLHGSLLPRHRGAAPVQWSLLSGDKDAGVSVIHMTPRLDGGPVLTKAALPINPDEDAEALESRLCELGVPPVLEALSMLETWDGHTEIGEHQPQDLVTKAPRFAKRDGQLDFRNSADYLARLVRACQPWPSTFCEFQARSGKKMRVMVRAARALTGKAAKEFSTTSDNLLTDVAKVTDFNWEAIQVSQPELAQALEREHGWHAPWNHCLAVQTSDGILLIGRIQPAGKRVMDANEFLRGHPLTDESFFILPDDPAQPLIV